MSTVAEPVVSLVRSPETVTSIQGWKRRIEKREARVGIIGLGYVGLPLTLLFASEGFRVTGFDVVGVKVGKLNRGESYIWRIEPDHIRAAQKNGFTATGEFREIAEMDAVLICVPTPLSEHHAPDLSYVETTVRAIAPYVREGQLIVLESTTYPGTTEELVVGILTEVGAERGVSVQTASDVPGRIDGVLVAFSPEREDPGNMITPRREIPKVIGGKCAVRLHLHAYGASQLPGNGGDDEAAREHLPVSEHRSGQ